MSKKITAKDACALILVSCGSSIKNGTTSIIPRISHISAKDPKIRAAFPIFLFIKLLFQYLYFKKELLFFIRELAIQDHTVV